MADTKSIVEGYYAGWNGGKLDGMGKYLASDLKFRGPMEQHDSANSFLTACKAMAEQMGDNVVTVDIEKLFVDGDEALAMYEFKSKGLSVPMAEYFKVKGGKIQEIKLHFDARKFEQ